MRITQTRKRFLSLSLMACLGLCATVPFNMGGCADATGSLGNMVTSVPGMAGSPMQGASGNKTQGYINAGVHGASALTLSEKDERAMGESVGLQVTAKYRITSNANVNRYVVLVGLTLASSCDHPDGNWLFAVVEDEQPNAFSGPDGFIFITTGALRQMQDESELAGVLAHEMTHVLLHHGLNAAKNSGVVAAGVEGLGTAMQANQAYNVFSGGVKGVSDVIFVKGYDRGQEDQADAGAVKLMSAAGYDPNGYLNFLSRIAAEQHSTIAAFSTHPDAAGRVAKVRAEIASAPKGGVMLKERFERMTK